MRSMLRRMVETDTDLSAAMRQPAPGRKPRRGLPWMMLMALSATAFSVVMLSFLSSRLHREEVAALAPKDERVTVQDTVPVAAEAPKDKTAVPDGTAAETAESWSLKGFFDDAQGQDTAGREASLPAEPFTMIRAMPASRTPVRRGGQ
ncbi:hypothetical protein AB9K41_01255 [Cribrihabitans sp. XS_ASV171]